MFFEQAMIRAAPGATAQRDDLRNVITTSDRVVETMSEAARLLAPSPTVAKAGH